MSMGPGGAPPTAEAKEARRLESTRPRNPQFATAREFNIWRDSLPRGDRVICDVICTPTGKPAAKGRKPYHCKRVVDRKVWNKLTAPQRGQWIERIRAEVGA